MTTTTSVFKLWTLLQEAALQKALPPNAVYSSEEPPPKGVVVYQTDRGKDYWVQPSREESWDADTKRSTLADLKARHEKQEKELSEQFKSLNLISHQTLAKKPRNKKLVSYDDASATAKQSGLLDRGGEEGQKEFSKLVKDVEKQETITVWHGTNLTNAQGIVESGEIYGDGSFGGGITLSPEEARGFAGGRRIMTEGRKTDRVKVLLQFELPSDQFKDFMPDVHAGKNSYTYRSVRTPVKIDSSKIKVLFDKEGRLDHRLASLHESHGGVSKDLLDALQSDDSIDSRMTFGMGTPASRYQDVLDAPDEHPRLHEYLKSISGGGVPSELTDDKETVDVLRKIQQNPNASVTIYRAVPEGISNIDAGDWITLSRKYAEMHLRNKSDKIISQSVTAKDVANARTSADEWILVPDEDTPVTKLHKFTQKEKEVIKQSPTVFKTWTLLQEAALQKEALPLGAVYVSEERPPKGTVIYFTEIQTPYWIRGPQAVGEEAPTQTDNVQVSDVTTQYNKEYNKAFNDFQEKFDDLLDDPSSETFKAMQDVVNHFMGQEIPEEGAPGGFGQPTGSIRTAIQQLKFSDNTEGLKLSVDGFESFSKKLREGGRTSEVKYKIFEALVGTRYPGNDGIEIPQHHLDNVIKLRMDARQTIRISGPQYEKLMKFAKSKSPISVRTVGFSIRTGSPFGLDATFMTPKAKKEMAKELQAAQVFGHSADPNSQVFLQSSPSLGNIVKLLNNKVSGIGGVCISHEHADEAAPKEASLISHSSKKTNLNSIVLYGVENKYSPDTDSKNPHNSITVVHELAHAVQADLPTEMQNEIKAQYLRALDTDKGFITWYSKAGGNNREFFAECYSAYFAHTKMFEKRNPEMADLLKRIFKTKMQSISVDDFEDGPSGGADAIDAHMGDINKEEKFKRYNNRIGVKTDELNRKIDRHLDKGTHNVPMAEAAFWTLMLKAFYVWKASSNGENPDKRKENVIADISEELGIVIPNGQDLPRRTDENESEGVEKSLQNMITLQERKNPLPPATDRVYIHEGKPAPAGVRIYDAGEFQGGHKGIQFWLATDENAHNAVKEHGHMVEDHSGDKDATVLTHGGTRPHVVMTKPLKEGGYPVIHEGKFFNGETLASAVKSFHDNKYPLRPDENLRTLVRDGKVDLPNPSSFTDGKKVSPEDFSKRSVLLRGVLQEGEDSLAKAIFQESALVQGRWANDDAERPDPDMDALTSQFPIKVPAVHWSDRATVIGKNIADGKTLINQKMVDVSAQKLYDHAQESLDARGLPDEFIVYRGHHPDDDDRETNDVLSISLSPEKAELFASKRPGGGEFGISDTTPAGREMEEAAPLLRAYRVRKSDILADTGSFTNNPYAEDELLIDWHTLRQRHVKSAKLPNTIWQPSTMKMLKFLQAEVDMEKSWYTNPRGAKDPHGKSIRKEGDGGGAFGESGGVAFTSTDSGIFTPTHSERERTPKKKKRSGVDRLADFLVDDSPERKMEKEKSLEKFLPLVVGLLGSTKASKDKKAIVKEGKRFHQQTSGETINNQPPRIDWAKGNKEMPREDGVSEFDGKPDVNAVISQKDEERRIRRLGAAADKTANAPANGDLRLRWESGGFESDALHSGSSKDKEKGDVEDPSDEHEDEEFIPMNESLKRMIKFIEES